ncbi:MAG: glycosyltransferase, partial [Oricola sp.]
QRLSYYNIEVLNLWMSDTGTLAIPRSVDLRQYEGLIIHPTVSYNPENIARLDRHLSVKLKDWPGVKILAKQDEMWRYAEVDVFATANRFDLILTCLPPSEWEKIYSKSMSAGCEFFQTLTGYVSSAQRALDYVPLSDRTVDVGYRGSQQPWAFGRLAWEKRDIGRTFAETVQSSDLKLDITNNWSGRLSGESWYKFLQNSRATLGVESGSNVFDADGSINKRVQKFESGVGRSLSETELYKRISEEIIGDEEGRIDYAQISPRHFEAAAAYTLQILYPGKYSGILKPWRHYVPLERDMSNIEEVVAFLRDDEKVGEMVRRARSEIIDASDYHYETYVAKLDDRIGKIFLDRGVPIRSPETAPKANVLLLMAHEPTLDPRIDWLASSLSERVNLCEIGTYDYGVEADGPTLQRHSPTRSRLRIKPEFRDFIADPLFEEPTSAGAVADSTYRLLIRTSNPDLFRRIAPNYGILTEREREQVVSYSQHFIKIAEALVEAGRRLDSCSAIVAADLDTLLAGAILAEHFGVPLIYDAHEFWPRQDVASTQAEMQFWERIERLLLPATSVRATVSTTLAELMTSIYGYDFLSVPNATTNTNALQENKPKCLPKDGWIDFLFQGRFAPQRGIEELVEAWPEVDSRARLVLRGPQNVYRDEIEALVGKSGLLGDRIIIEAPVTEDELINAASCAHVGIIPYKPVGANYANCCPNKLSQYLAAGLPILANRTNFVGRFVGENRLGAVCDFSSASELKGAVAQIVNSPAGYAEMSARSLKTFREKFNWSVVSKDFTDAIVQAAEANPCR